MLILFCVCGVGVVLGVLFCVGRGGYGVVRVVELVLLGFGRFDKPSWKIKGLSSGSWRPSLCFLCAIFGTCWRSWGLSWKSHPKVIMRV